MKKIVLICPSNILYMPYIKNYEKIMKKKNYKYEIINWDRFEMEDDKNKYTYRDKKTGHKRNYLDYYKYKKYIEKVLENNKYDKIIVFGLQLTYFLKGYLLNKFEGEFIVDIRDYNRVINFFNLNEVINKSYQTVISSPGYKIWLPKNKNYVINHNTTIEVVKESQVVSQMFYDDVINLSYIGTLTNIKTNKRLINTLKNNEMFKVKFHGKGIINDELKEKKRKENIENLIITDKYNEKEEVLLYESAHFINLLLDNTNINSRTCLANRLYNSIIYGRPLIVLEGSYISKQVKKFNLGIVLESLENLDQIIIEYMNGFDVNKYNEGRIQFIKNVRHDNVIFEKELKKFINIE